MFVSFSFSLVSCRRSSDFPIKQNEREWIFKLRAQLFVRWSFSGSATFANDEKSRLTKTLNEAEEARTIGPQAPSAATRTERKQKQRSERRLRERGGLTWRWSCCMLMRDPTKERNNGTSPLSKAAEKLAKKMQNQTVRRQLWIALLLLFFRFYGLLCFCGQVPENDVAAPARRKLDTDHHSRVKNKARIMLHFRSVWSASAKKKKQQMEKKM